MQQPVDERSGHDFVAQDLTPLFEPFVGREHGGCALVAPVDELELGLALVMAVRAWSSVERRPLPILGDKYDLTCVKLCFTLQR